MKNVNVAPIGASESVDKIVATPQQLAFIAEQNAAIAENIPVVPATVASVTDWKNGNGATIIFVGTEGVLKDQAMHGCMWSNTSGIPKPEVGELLNVYPKIVFNDYIGDIEVSCTLTKYFLKTNPKLF